MMYNIAIHAVLLFLCGLQELDSDVQKSDYRLPFSIDFCRLLVTKWR